MDKISQKYSEFMWRWVWCGAGKQFITENEQKKIDRIGQDYLGNCNFLQKLYSIKHRQKIQKCQHIDENNHEYNYWSYRCQAVTSCNFEPIF